MRIKSTRRNLRVIDLLLAKMKKSGKPTRIFVSSERLNRALLWQLTLNILGGGFFSYRGFSNSKHCNAVMAIDNSLTSDVLAIIEIDKWILWQCRYIWLMTIDDALTVMKVDNASTDDNMIVSLTDGNWQCWALTDDIWVNALIWIYVQISLWATTISV